MFKTTITPPLPDGFLSVASSQGLAVEIAPDGIYASDAIAVQALFASYSGSASELQWQQQQKQSALDILFNEHFDLAAFIRNGTVIGITATQVGTFLATIVNNYRTLRANIAAATSLAQVQAIDVTKGWPSNP